MPASSVIAAVQAFNIVSTAFATGLSFSLTAISIPTIVEAPPPVLATRQWDTTFWKGSALVRPWFGTAALLSFYLAWTAYAAADVSAWAWKLYLIGGLSSFAIFPYTIIILNPVNNKLLGKMEQFKGWKYTDLPEKEAGISSNMIHQLIEKWGSLNILRTVMFAITVLTTTIAAFYL